MDSCAVLDIAGDPADSQAAAWVNLSPDADQAVLPTQAEITLSPSSINTFLACPRLYFYRSVLKLPSKETKKGAVLGTLIHQLMETLNTFFAQDYTLENLLDLVALCFSEDKEWDKLHALDINEKDIAPIEALAPLQQMQMQNYLVKAFQDLAVQGYFDQPFQNLVPEAEIKIENVLGVSGVHLQGRMDLIRHLPNGRVQIVDYKTSRSQYTSTRYETNMATVLNALAPVDWEESNLALRYADRDYQLPLYWWLQQQRASQPVDMAIQVIRAPNATGKGGGMVLPVEHDVLLNAKPVIEDVLMNGVIEPLKNIQTFLALGAETGLCAVCDYANICEGSAGSPSEWGDA